MCDCKKNLEAKLTERFKEKLPDASNHRAELMGYALGIGAESMSMYLVGCMPIELTADSPMKGGVLQRRKKVKQSMFFTFCPFCGERYEVKS